MFDGERAGHQANFERNAAMRRKRAKVRGEDCAQVAIHWTVATGVSGDPGQQPKDRAKQGLGVAPVDHYGDGVGVSGSHGDP